MIFLAWLGVVVLLAWWPIGIGVVGYRLRMEAKQEGGWRKLWQFERSRYTTGTLITLILVAIIFWPILLGGD